MDKIIYHSIRLNCDCKTAFEMFTANKHLEKWLTQMADVEPKVGGRYELFWNPENKMDDSTIGCRILAISPGKLLCFEWKGPKHFKHFMNNVRPLTNVVAFFTSFQSGSEVHLLHTGWRDTNEWEQARQLFDRTWKAVLSELQVYVELLKCESG